MEFEIPFQPDVAGDHEIKPSYWLLADNWIPLAADRTRMASFAAYMKHALLFHKRILLSDSLVVNSPNFRRVLQADPQLRDYLAEEALVIAQRADEERFQELLQLRDMFDANNSRNQNFQSDLASFRFSGDLEVLQKSAVKKPYKLAQLKDFYTGKVKEMTENPIFLDLLGPDAAVVCKEILRKIEADGFVDQRFFERPGPGSLQDQLGEAVWGRAGQTVTEFESAYYRMAVPAVVGADIIFSPEHQQHRKVLRHIKADGEGGSVRVDLSRGSESLYESLLLSLSVDKLRKLRDSNEFKELQSKLALLQGLSDIDDPKLTTALQEVYVALEAYHKQIDSALAVMKYYDQGSAVLDRWNLKGVLNGGHWLLKFGAETLGKKTFRAAATMKLAEWMRPGSGIYCLIYYAGGENFGVEQAFDRLPAKVKDLEHRLQLAGTEPKKIDADLAIAPRSFKDTIYSGS